MGMRQSRPLAGGDDCVERVTVGSEQTHAIVDFSSQVELAHVRFVVAQRLLKGG